MAFTGLSILTHGWHHPTGDVDVEIITADAPVITSVLEVRPTVRIQPQVTTPSVTGEPTVTAAEPVVPRIVDTEGPQQQTGADEPTITGAENLTPRIVKAEEE